MSIIVLESADARVEIDSMGAYVRSLTNIGRDLLFPAQQIGEKVRGGMPVCAPIFGPGDAVGLKQHGFARDVEWMIAKQSDDTVRLTFEASSQKDIPDPYVGCAMSYTVKLRENMLSAVLTVANSGATAFVCSPGLHPYFVTDDATSVVISADVSRHFDASELAATQFLPPHQEWVTVELKGASAKLTSTTLQRYAVWSANPDRYLCVEPTWAGNLADQTILPLLPPGEQKTFEMTLGWSIA